MPVDAVKSAKIERILRQEPLARLSSGALCFLPGAREPKDTAGGGLQAHVQDFFKRHGNLYGLLVRLFGPVYAGGAYQRGVREMLVRYTEADTILNLGSGPDYVQDRRDVINVDIYAFDAVDLVADGQTLPLADASVDGILCLVMLEHVPEPDRVVAEMHRLLRPGGRVLACVPFLQPVHAAPADFHRWTPAGAARLFSAFQDVQVTVGAGPTSGVLWPFLEWLATVLSLGHPTLHDMVLLVLMVLSAPIKLLDAVLTRVPGAEKIASNYLVAGRK